jgi:hypothetical protein
MPDNAPKASRRGFFAGAATVGAAAAAVATLPKLSPTESTEQPKLAPTKGGGYSLSEHVKRYYQTTRV